MLTSTLSANHRYRDGSVYENTPDTAYAYTSRADGQAASVTFRPDTAQATSFTTTYGYDANQHLTSAQINDGRPRRVEYVNDAQGQVLVRREADNTAYSAGTGKGGDPLQSIAASLFADQRNHINGIENFWNQAKRHLRGYNGIPRQHFHLFIKECEWRFNDRPIGRMQQTLAQWWFK